ncbi:MAG: TetR/AcrR family transcriptional regulator [Oscillospiraceae bacterium]|nr:TetR/AcrR family transcriptional regulator [Oscillospiraceae bacterium]
MTTTPKHNSDKRVIRTKKAIKNALFEIMNNKDIAEISISELTACANINRRTFYTHYRNITDILDEIESDLVASLAQLLSSNDRNDIKNSTKKIFLGFHKLISEEFEYYFKHMRMDVRGRLTSRLRNAIKASTASLYKNTFPESDENGNIISAFVAGGFLACYMEWYYSEERIPIEKAAEMVGIMTEVCSGARSESL